MAAEDDGRTEEASEYKIEKARKEGRVAKTQELAGAMVLFFTVLVLVFISKWILGQCVEIMNYYFARTSNPDINDPNLGIAFLNYFLKIVLPTSAVGMVAAFAGNIIQTKGFIFSTKPIQPDFSKIVPKFGEYFKRTMFSAQGLFNIAKSLGKVALICFIAYLLIRSNIWDIVQIISNGNVGMALGKIAWTAAKLLIIVSVLFMAIAIPDYFVQKHEFMERMKMTKQEQKEEFKEMEGDPEVKAKLAQMQKQLLQQNIPKAVKESDVVITNPTHFAVALKYDPDSGLNGPMVKAKGEDEDAFYIKRIAQENDIPVVEDKPVARGLYADAEVGMVIPENYFTIIATIYSHILKK